MKQEIAKLVELDRQRTLLTHIGAVLGWDQETYLPEKGIEERSEQLSLIEGLAHEKAVDPQIGELLASAEAAAETAEDLSPEEAAYIKLTRREYDKETKLPSEFVMEYAKQASLSQAAWSQAKSANDFSLFAPHLETMIRMNKERAAYLDSGRKPYDVLLDLYEYGSTEASIAAVFSVMKKDLVALLDKIAGQPPVDDAFLHAPVSAEIQAKMSRYLMDAVGYDQKRGRLDTTAHPFTTTLGRDDVRITTRYVENYFPSSIFSTIHESGHALYEMNIDPHPDFRGTRLAEAVSMAVHESQSRMLENFVGRSRAFWEKHYPAIRAMAGEPLADVDVDRFVKAINKVERSLIRTEADEVTYGLHVIVRFELESAIMSGSLAVKDIPQAWNAKIKELLGLDVPNDRLGCLQDVHWSMGAFGYFPSYALGNLYAAQFWEVMQEQIPNLEQKISRGELGDMQQWLKVNVHSKGSLYLPGELLQKVTGKPLDPSCFARYLNKKFS